MISVLKADSMIGQNLKKVSSSVVSLDQAYYCCLREDVHADRDWPSYDKSLMDGIAISLEAYKKGVREFKIKGVQKAGIDALKLDNQAQCTEIMTGAVLSKGADCVVPIEQVLIKGRRAHLKDGLELARFQSVRKKGADFKKGRRLLKASDVLGPAQIAICASVGKSKLRITKKPRIAIVSTGDEIVDIDKKCKPYQIRRSNSFFIHAALLREGLFEPVMFHLKDNKVRLLKELKKILKEYDGVVLSGGVSMGKLDFVPQVLKELGVKELFHKVRQRPGKPFWFGVTRDHRGVFALPGNPVATQVGTYRYVLPHLKQTLGFKSEDVFAQLTKDVVINTDFTYFLPIQTRSAKDGKLEAEPIKTGGSGDLMNLNNSDGFMEIPEKKGKVKKGFIGKVYLW